MRITERGFSLVEVIISAGLLTGAVATLAQLITTCAGTDAAAGHLTLAALYAQQKVEQLRSEPALDDTPRTSEHLDSGGAILCRDTPACAGAVYVRGWSVQASTLVPSAVFVQVDVRPETGTGRPVNLITVRPRAW